MWCCGGIHELKGHLLQSYFRVHLGMAKRRSPATRSGKPDTSDSCLRKSGHRRHVWSGICRQQPATFRWSSHFAKYVDKNSQNILDVCKCVVTHICTTASHNRRPIMWKRFSCKSLSVTQRHLATPYGAQILACYLKVPSHYLNHYWHNSMIFVKSVRGQWVKISC